METLVWDELEQVEGRQQKLSKGDYGISVLIISKTGLLPFIISLFYYLCERCSILG